MDRQVMLQHLAMVERHIAEGQIHLSRQEAVVAQLDRLGYDPADALMILATMRQTQQLHKLDRERILKELEPRSYP